jgi:hypothetical protein
MKLHPVMENIAHETEAATRASMRTMRAALSSERKALHSRLIPSGEGGVMDLKPCPFCGHNHVEGHTDACLLGSRLKGAS